MNYLSQSAGDKFLWIRRPWKAAHQQDVPGHHFPDQRPPPCLPAPPCPNPTIQQQSASRTDELVFFTMIGKRDLTVIMRICSFPHLVHGLITGVLQREVHHGVLEGAAHVELKGDVVHSLRCREEGRNETEWADFHCTIRMKETISTVSWWVEIYEIICQMSQQHPPLSLLLL